MGREIFPSTAKRCNINLRLYSQIKKRLSKESQLPIQKNEAKIMGQLQNNLGIAVRLDYIISDVLGEIINQKMNSNNLLQKYSIFHLSGCQEIIKQ